MTKKQGFAFEFELPAGWADDSGDRQVVAHGPQDEELIVSGAISTGPTSPDGAASIKNAVLRNAFQAVKTAADLPELRVTKSLGQESVPSRLECWTLHAETTDGETAFLQGVVASDIAVMIATLEGPNQASTIEAFRSFLEGVRRAVVQ